MSRPRPPSSAPAHPRLQRVGVIGVGRVGSVLAARLAAVGHPVSVIGGRTPVETLRSRPLLTGVEIAPSLHHLVEHGDLLVLAVPDDRIADVVRDLVPVVGPGQVVIHTSGAHGTRILAPVAARGARVLAVHPAMTFTTTSTDLPPGCMFAVTCSNDDAEIARTIVDELGGTIARIAESDRAAYHAALTHGANHLCTVVNQAMDQLRAVIGDADPSALLRPLLTTALDNTLAHGDDALTGPVSRGDVATVRSHLAAIHDRRIRDSYRALAAATTDRAERSGRIDAAGAAAMHRALDDQPTTPRSKETVTMTPRVVRTLKELRHATAGGTVALVPTMGALHDGHVSLMEHARPMADILVVSVFVNPTQFGPGEDFDSYPRTFDQDVARCAEAGVDVVFAPTVDIVYPEGFDGSGTHDLITVEPGRLGTILEGASRPTHFRGVLTVVARLFGLVRPDVAVFGEKDYQQLVLITRMTQALSLGVRVVGCPTVREPDGLALSSRNQYLSDPERQLAAGISAALRAGVDAAPAGPDAVVAAAEKCLADAGISPDYVALTSPDLTDPQPGREARLLIAARIGTPRLIDNIAITPENWEPHR